MRVRLIAFVLALVAVLAAAAGCGADGKGDRSPGGPAATGVPPGTGPTAAPVPGGPPPGTPDRLVFTAATVDGKPFAGVTLLGRPAVLWFWAPDCAACRAQAAETDRVGALRADRVTVVGVSSRGETAALRGFVADTRTGAFPHIADGSGAVWQRFEVAEPGTYVLLDASGAVVFRGVLPRGEGLLGRVDALAR